MITEELKIMWNKKLIVENEIFRATGEGFPTVLFPTIKPIVIDEDMQKKIDGGIRLISLINNTNGSPTKCNSKVKTTITKPSI